MQSIKDRQILLIGGYGALGENLVTALQQQEADIVIADIKRVKEQPFDDIPYFKLNVLKPSSLQNFRQRIESKGYQLAHVVNFVGGLQESGLTDIFKTSAQEIVNTINVNLLSQLNAVHFLAPHLRETEGDKSFVSIGSINSELGFSIPYYSAAKGGMLSFIKPAAMDLGRYGIRINVVSPGTIITPSTKKQPKDFDDRKNAAALGRLCTPEDVSDAILACLTMKNFTGQNLIIDAGQTAGAPSSLYEQERRSAALKRSIGEFKL